MIILRFDRLISKPKFIQSIFAIKPLGQAQLFMYVYFLFN